MDKQTLDLMRAFDESVTQFKQFSEALVTLKKQMKQLESELFSILELAEVEQLNEKVHQTMTGLELMNRELRDISSQYESLMMKQAKKDEEVMNQLMKLEQQLRLVAQQNEQFAMQRRVLVAGLETNVITVKDAINQQLITLEQVELFQLTNESSQHDSFILVQGRSVLLYHSETNVLSLIQPNQLLTLLENCPSNVAIHGLELYVLTNEHVLMCHHLLSKEQTELASNVSLVKLVNHQLIYLQEETLVVKNLESKL